MVLIRLIPPSAIRLVSRDSTFSVVPGWLLAGRPRGRSSSPGGVKDFLFPLSFRPALGSTQPPIQWGPVLFSPKGKPSGTCSYHSSPASAEVKKMWIYTSTPTYAFICLISSSTGTILTLQSVWILDNRRLIWLEVSWKFYFKTI
jgi:hypothetical protein